MCSWHLCHGHALKVMCYTPIAPVGGRNRDLAAMDGSLELSYRPKIRNYTKRIS